MKEKKLILPEIPNRDIEKKGIPTYSNELGKIKEAIDGSIPSYESVRPIKHSNPLVIPKRKPIVRIKKQETIGPNIPENINKPIFVKLEDYKIAKDHLEKVKEMAKNAEGLLKDLNQTREEEDRELEKWKGEIEKIKDNLLKIDKKLFEL
jgi:Sec7-like guanine-nucleotide exchange factor